MSKQSKASMILIEETLEDLIEKISLERLMAHSKRSTITLHPLPLTYDLSHDHWICIVWVICAGMNITMKCHFSTKAARELTTHALGREDFSPESCHAFVTEYCNLLSGEVRAAIVNPILGHFSKSVDEAKLTPPQKNPSFDLGLSVQKVNTRKCLWNLDWGTNQLTILGMIELDEKKIIENINGNFETLIEKIRTFKISDSGEVEWF